MFDKVELEPLQDYEKDPGLDLSILDYVREGDNYLTVTPKVLPRHGVGKSWRVNISY
jgi:hypothetical protein